jgi:glyoxylase I family protein
MMEKVSGIGGFFFRAREPEALSKWYEQHLGITLPPTDYGTPAWQQQAGTKVFVPFPEDTPYFGDMDKSWMMNFWVADLMKMVEQLRTAGIEVEVDPEIYPNGKFARLKDLEGNPIQLWEPQGVAG